MHISDGILDASTCVAGYVAAGGLVAVGLRRSGQADSARAGILTAAFFLAGLVRFPLPGTSVHLLLASLNGIALGTLCFPSIFLALLLQALLLGHGGISTLGVNMVIMAVPAYLAGALFHKGLKRGASGWLIFFLTVTGVLVLGARLLTEALFEVGLLDFELSWLSSAALGGALAGVIFLALRFGKKPGPVHVWGFSAGALSVFFSAVLFYLVLSFAPLAAHAAREGFVELARFAFVFHVPVIAVEGIVVALLVRYLDTVTPELLRVRKPAAAFIVMAISLLLFMPLSVKAHAVGADAYVEDGQITVEVWTDGGDVPSSGRVIVLGPEGEQVARGDIQEGKWSFRPESAEAFRFIVDIGHGHGKTFSLHPDEVKKLQKDPASNAPEKQEEARKVSEGVAKTSEEMGTVKHERRRPGPSYADTFIKALLGLLIIGMICAFLMLRNLRHEVDELKKRLDKDA